MVISRISVGNSWAKDEGCISFSSANCHSVYEFICAPVLLCVEDLVSLVYLSPLAIMIFLLHPMKDSLSPENIDLVETSHLEFSISRYLTLCTLSDCEFLYLFPSTEEWSLSVDALICEYHFIAVLFQQSISIWFSLSFLAYLTPDDYSPESFQVWAPSHGVGLKYIQILFHYAHKLFTLTTIVHLVGMSSL